jgi:hypothetical protein
VWQGQTNLAPPAPHASHPIPPFLRSSVSNVLERTALAGFERINSTFSSHAPHCQSGEGVRTRAFRVCCGARFGAGPAQLAQQLLPEAPFWAQRSMRLRFMTTVPPRRYCWQRCKGHEEERRREKGKDPALATVEPGVLADAALQAARPSPCRRHAVVPRRRAHPHYTPRQPWHKTRRAPIRVRHSSTPSYTFSPGGRHANCCSSLVLSRTSHSCLRFREVCGEN